MSYVAIPSEVFESDEYRLLTFGDREFLLRLYHLFGDCETFTLDYRTPEQYGELRYSCTTSKLRRILESGLVVLREKELREKRGPQLRIYGFKYSAVPFYEAA